MSVVLGFGSTETAIEQAECDFVDKFVRENSPTEGYITPEFAKLVEASVKQRGDEYRALVATYKDSDEHPDRYSSFYATVLNDASHIVVIFKFSHINRRHPFSPDGWAMLCTTKLHLADYEL